MQLNLYKKHFDRYFSEAIVSQQIKDSVELIKNSVKRIFFIGNGGSNSICSHMMEDFAKIARFPTFSFSDAALITCFANDYGYERAMEEWLKIHFMEGDLLIAISSSGESKNILNATQYVREKKGSIITFSGFNPNNYLCSLGHINFHIDVANYGIVECYHQVLLHIILDSLKND
ncbi:SIS domain-containing protein [Haliscomenobacter sp.]|uniref:SIS domain-containing protein n=1 Tax=Haliscomenobacter sp. TaxID=2717303 RepID=UPI003BAD8D65